MKPVHLMKPLMLALLDDPDSLSDAQVFCVLHTMLAKAADDWEAPILTARPNAFAQAAFAALQFQAEAGPLQLIDHAQVAIPKGGAAEAISFYHDLLGLNQTPKLPQMAARGGAWYQGRHVKVHLGVEEPFHGNVKAHVTSVVMMSRSLPKRPPVWALQSSMTTSCPATTAPSFMTRLAIALRFCGPFSRRMRKLASP